MPPAPVQSNSAPVQRTSPSTAIKATRIFFFILIITGIGLIATEKLWVPKLVNTLLGNQIPNIKSLQNLSTSISIQPLLTPDGQTTVYGKDSAYIYISNGNGGWSQPYAGITEPANFSKLYPNNYFVSGVDTSSFMMLSQNYSKDKNNAYYSTGIVDLTKISAADASSFTTSTQLGLFAKDKQHVFLETNMVPGADPNTFQYLGPDSYGQSDSGYAKDTDNVYWYGGAGEIAIAKVIDGADPVTFQIVNGQSNYDAQDKNHNYLDGKIVREDPQTATTTTTITDEYDAYFHGGTVIYKCDNNKTISATYSQPDSAYNNAANVVLLTLSDGRSLELQNAHIENGARFSNTDMSINFWSSGQNNDWLQENGTTTYNDCQDPKYR